MKCHLVLNTLVFFLTCMFASVSGKVFPEKQVLLEFKHSVSDPSGVLSSWDSNNSNHCSWVGVACDSKSRVSSLNITGGGGGQGNSEAFSCSKLSQFPFHGFGIRRACSYSNGKLAGKISPLIGNLTELRVLSLPYNDFTGVIPVEILGLKKLEVLDLEENSFTGKLPNQFAGLRNLRVLNLGFNRIHGEIPYSLSKCVNLRVLNLAGNKVNGTIPGFFASFPKLQGLYLSHNELNGSVPVEFGLNCQNLEHLDLSGNFLIGRIPGSLGECQRLRSLLLFSNMLNEVIPLELGRLRMLEVLDVSRNSLSGPIPAELGNCVNLSVLVLKNLFDPVPKNRKLSEDSMVTDDYNYFQGSIPVEVTTLPKLRIVWAPKATLEGKIPSNWGDCESLEMVNLGQNLFSGELHGAFGGCKNLHFLDLNSNLLTGELDKKLHVPCMTLFDVNGNLLSGPIPRFNQSVCPCVSSLNSDLAQAYNPSLAYLSFFMHRTRIGTPLPFSGASFVVIHNFGRNNFTGAIQWLPLAEERLGKQTDYAFLADRNKLTGSFPGSLFEKCDKLNGMIASVSNNKISGEIPLKIDAMCRSLRFLDASENQISGSIPLSLGDLNSLVALDLSGNKLQGPIPSALHRMKCLKFLSLADNNLTDAVPSSLGWLHSIKVLKLSSNSLSGEIPQGLAKLRNLTVLLLNNNKLSGQIPSGLANVTSLITFNVSYNNLSGLVPLSGDVINCSSALGNPLLYSCHMVSPSALSSNLPSCCEESLNYAAFPSGGVNETGNHGLNSIEIASIISASAIVLVLLVLVILFFYTRKWIPDARVQVSESREITVFTDIGVPLTFENIVRATGNFNASNCIGNGGFGATYKAKISPGTLVAVKRLAVGRYQGVQQFHAEIKTLGRVRHPNLVTLIGYHAGETEMFLVYNYLPGGNLENFIKERSTRTFDWKILHKIALDIARALTYLHDRCIPRVLHRDVKPSNILLDNDFNAYLSDFGLSRLLGISETHATTGVAGTFGYVAPEYAMTCRVSEKADVYSYGVVLLELISDKKALDPSFSSHGNGFNIVSWVCMMLRQGLAKEVLAAGLWEAGPQGHLVEMLHLAVMCTVESRSIRPTMKQVVQRLKQIQPAVNAS